MQQNETSTTNPASSEGNKGDQKDNDNVDECNEIASESGMEYKLESVIGRGTFGLVYLACNKKNPKEKFAIKRYFKNLHPNLCQLEISILSYLNQKTNADNILKLYDGFIKNQDLFLIMSYQPHQKFSEYYSDLPLNKLKVYMKALLSSLNTIHKLGIVHRDIKPDNFLFDIHTGKSMLIDFGLAEADLDTRLWTQINQGSTNEDYIIISELQKNNYRHRTGTKGFLAPEIIFHAQYQSSPVDIWAAGVVFLCFLSKRLPVFNLNKFSKITDETIRELEPLIVVYGKDAIIEIAQKFKSFMYVSDVFDKYKLEKGIETLIMRKDIDKNGVDLLKKMMELDPEKRITAEEALKHPFFDNILPIE